MQSSRVALKPMEDASQPAPRKPRLVEEGASPMRLLRELAHAGFSGILTLQLVEGVLHVWLSRGRIAWAEGSGQQRSLSQVLRELLAVDRAGLVELAADWRRRGLSLAEGVLAQPGMTECKLRLALQEHLGEALQPVTSNPPCMYRKTSHSQGTSYAPQWTFALAEVLRTRCRGTVARESLADLLRRVYGARGVDLVSGGAAAGLAQHSEADRELVEAADQLLLGHADGVELALLRGPFGTWAGMRPSEAMQEESTWLSFDPEVGLGGALLGLQAVYPHLDPLRALPSPPPLRSMPSIFPGADARVRYRAALAPALELGDGALAAHVLERDVVVWGSHSSASDRARSWGATVARGCSALELTPPPNLTLLTNSGQLESFVMLDGRSGFHVATRVPGTVRTFLALTFAAGSSYGSSIAALSLGASALARELAER